jgi:hypothetical protein
MSKGGISVVHALAIPHNNGMADVIELVSAVRAGEVFPGGNYKTERHYLDVVVNGVSLGSRVGRPKDTVSAFCAAFDLPKAVDRFLLRASADFPSGRLALFVCPECGDLGCGAVTLFAEKVQGKIMWRDFGYENDYDGEIFTDDYRDVGPFEFEEDAYTATLLSAVEKAEP